MDPPPRPKWADSELPFYVVLRESAPSDAPADSTHTELMYPEVRYIFEDDDFSPSMDVLEQDKNDISVIVDFDATGDQVVRFQSLSPSWQVLNVATTSSSVPNWAGQDGSSTTVLVVDGTSSDVRVSEPQAHSLTSSSTTGNQGLSDAVTEALADTRHLVAHFKSRNEQLEVIISE